MKALKHWGYLYLVVCMSWWWLFQKMYTQTHQYNISLLFSLPFQVHTSLAFIITYSLSPHSSLTFFLILLLQFLQASGQHSLNLFLSVSILTYTASVIFINFRCIHLV